MLSRSLEQVNASSFSDNVHPVVDTTDLIQPTEAEHDDADSASLSLYFEARAHFSASDLTLDEIEAMNVEQNNTDREQANIEHEQLDTDRDHISIENVDLDQASTAQDRVGINTIDWGQTSTTQEQLDTDRDHISIENVDQSQAEVEQDPRIDQYYTLLRDKVFLISDNDANTLKEEIKTNLQDSKLYGRIMERLANIYAEKESPDRSNAAKFLSDALAYKQTMRLKSAITRMHNRSEARLEHLQSQREDKGWGYYHIARGLEVHKLKQDTNSLHRDIRKQANHIFQDNIQTIDRLAEKYGVDKERTFDAIQYSLHSSEYTAEMTNFFTIARKKNYAIDLLRALAGHSSKPDAAQPIVDNVINKQPDPFETRPTDYLNRDDLMPILNDGKGKARAQDTRTQDSNELDQRISRYYDFLTTKVFEMPEKSASSLREEIAQQLETTPLYEQRIEKLMSLYESGRSSGIRTKERLKEYLTKTHGRYEERLDHKRLERQERAQTSEIRGDFYYNVTNRLEVNWLKSETNSIQRTTRKEAEELFSQHEKVFNDYLNDIQAKGQNISKQAFFDALVYSLHSAQHKAHARVLFERSQPGSTEQVYEFARETLTVASQALHAQWGTLAYDKWEGVFDAPRPW